MTDQPDPKALLALNDNDLWIELGKAIRTEGLGMLPEELDKKPNDANTGLWFFDRQFSNIKKLYCTQQVARLVTDEKRRDVTEFVASLVDLFAAYFGVIPGTIILVKIYKIGVDRFCQMSTTE